MDAQVKFDDGIPPFSCRGLPGQRSGRYHDILSIMRVGQSFLIEAYGLKRNSIIGYSFRSPPGRWIVRKTREGYRCWRVA